MRACGCTRRSSAADRRGLAHTGRRAARLRDARDGDWHRMERDGVRWLLQDLLGVLVALGIFLLMVAAVGIGTAIGGG